MNCKILKRRSQVTHGGEVETGSFIWQHRPSQPLLSHTNRAQRENSLSHKAVLKARAVVAPSPPPNAPTQVSWWCSVLVDFPNPFPPCRGFREKREESQWSATFSFRHGSSPWCACSPSSFLFFYPSLFPQFFLSVLLCSFNWSENQNPQTGNCYSTYEERNKKPGMHSTLFLNAYFYLIFFTVLLLRFLCPFISVHLLF